MVGGTHGSWMEFLEFSSVVVPCVLCVPLCPPVSHLPRLCLCQIELIAGAGDLTRVHHYHHCYYYPGHHCY